MIKLPNNCRVGKFSVYPKNWNTKKAKLSEPWRVVYWFYDDNIPAKKQIRFQGMNEVLELLERQSITRILLEDELKLLQSGYNPIKAKYEAVNTGKSERCGSVIHQEFTVTVYKGKQAREDLQAITQEALPFWRSLIRKAVSPEGYVFSAGLLPGTDPINPKQIPSCWYEHIKKPGVSSADFYSLKHFFLDSIAATESLEAAQKAAGTHQFNTTRIYTVNQKRRELKHNKELKVSFIKKAK